MKQVLLAATFVAGLMQPLAVSAAPNEHAHRVDTIAHRGASGYAPENTMAAFLEAVKMKADYIEIDVQMTRDGHLVVIHDTTVDRTTDGTGEVGSFTLEEIRQLDAGSFFAPEFAGEPIPTFEEVLDEFRGKVGILIELKAPELYPGMEERVAAALAERNMDKPKNHKIIVQSFNFDAMKTFHELLPSVPVGVLTSKEEDLTDEKLEKFSTYASYVNPTQKLVTKDLVERIHERDMRISVWTVRKPEEVKPLLEAGVDGIITDYPDYVPRNKK